VNVRAAKGLRAFHLDRNALRRATNWLVGSPTGLVASAIVVGLGAGVGAVAFRYLILWFTVLFTGYQDYAGAGHVANPLIPFLGMWFVVFCTVH